MTAKNEDVAVDRSGAVHPLGGEATLRLQSRAGTYGVLQTPQHLIVMRRKDGEDQRPCVMGGEVRSAGILCDVISFFGQCGFRGELVVYAGADHRSIFFDQGHIVGAKSSVVRERLGEVLYRHGVLSREQVDECAEASLGGRLRFGEAAVKAGHVDREQLFRMMGLQIEEIVYGTLLVDQGTYWFLDGYREDELSTIDKKPIGELVREGVRRMHEARFFKTRIPTERHVPVRSSEKPPPDIDVAGIYALIDGQRSIADLCRTLGAGEFEVMRSVYQLVQSGHVSIRTPHAHVRDSVRIFNEAIAILLRELDAIDEGDQVRGVIAAFVAERPILSRMMEGAGPLDDGTLDIERVEQNVGDTRDAEDALAASLYELASYALFLARPHLKRVQPTPSKRTVSVRIASVLAPIAPPESPPQTGGREEVKPTKR